MSPAFGDECKGGKRCFPWVNSTYKKQTFRMFFLKIETFCKLAAVTPF